MNIKSTITNPRHAPRDQNGKVVLPDGIYNTYPKGSTYMYNPHRKIMVVGEKCWLISDRQYVFNTSHFFEANNLYLG